MENFIQFLYSKFLQSDGVSIDTRTLEEGNLFFALKGPSFNGNTYAGKAIEMGASFAVVDEKKYADGKRIIYTKDSLETLRELAIFHRSRYKRVVIGLTGSNGKTTTKELLTAVLSKKYVVHSTPGNYNNHIGVPLTLLHLFPQVEIAVIEMGANHVGEIADLCRIANPTHGLITNIGKAHTETFGGIEGVLRGKSELFDHLKKSKGKVFINTNDHRLSNMKRRFEDCEEYPEKGMVLDSSDPFLKVRMGTEEIRTRLVGDYNFENVAAAIKVGRFFGVGDENIAEAIRDYTPENMRSQVIVKNGTQLIMDAYNANPDSMKKAVQNLSTFEGKKLAILGEMNELENEEKEHQEIGKLLNELDVPAILVGPKMKSTSEKYKGLIWFENKEHAAEHLQKTDLRQSTVLLKASRSLKLETLRDSILH